MPLITITEAAAILGRDPSTISRAVSAGRLSFAPGTRMLEREGIEQRFAARTRPRVDRPQAKPLNRGAQADYWRELTWLLNTKYLDHSDGAWPRFTPDELLVFVGCLEMAAEEIA